MKPQFWLTNKSPATVYMGDTIYSTTPSNSKVSALLNLYKHRKLRKSGDRGICFKIKKKYPTKNKNKHKKQLKEIDKQYTR